MRHTSSSHEGSSKRPLWPLLCWTLPQLSLFVASASSPSLPSARFDLCRAWTICNSSVSFLVVTRRGGFGPLGFNADMGDAFSIFPSRLCGLLPNPYGGQRLVLGEAGSLWEEPCLFLFDRLLNVSVLSTLKLPLSPRTTAPWRSKSQRDIRRHTMNDTAALRKKSLKMEADLQVKVHSNRFRCTAFFMGVICQCLRVRWECWLNVSAFLNKGN